MLFLNCRQLNWQDSDEEILSDDDDPKHRFGKKIVIIKHLFNPSEADVCSYVLRYFNLE